MTPEFAESADPVFLHVLDMLERISRGERPDPHEERLHIKGWLDRAERKLGQRVDWELAKYALVSWIDEMLIEAPWEGRRWWTENALEVELFGTGLANEQFYLKAKEAATLPRRDALEVYYVCVVLGFRGLYRDPLAAAALAEPRGLPPDLESWAKQTAIAIRLGQGRPPLVETGTPGAGAPPLSASSSLASAVMVGVVLAALGTTLLALEGWGGSSAAAPPRAASEAAQ